MLLKPRSVLDPKASVTVSSAINTGAAAVHNSVSSSQLSLILWTMQRIGLLFSDCALSSRRRRRRPRPPDVISPLFLKRAKSKRLASRSRAVRAIHRLRANLTRTVAVINEDIHVELLELLELYSELLLARFGLLDQK